MRSGSESRTKKSCDRSRGLGRSSAKSSWSIRMRNYFEIGARFIGARHSGREFYPDLRTAAIPADSYQAGGARQFHECRGQTTMESRRALLPPGTPFARWPALTTGWLQDE